MERKIVQIAAMPCGQILPSKDRSTGHYVEHTNILYALCDDGTLWSLKSKYGWEKIHPVPQKESPND